jgi:hypothetical protein
MTHPFLIEDAPALLCLAHGEPVLEGIEHPFRENPERNVEEGGYPFRLTLINVDHAGLSGAAQATLRASEPQPIIEEISPFESDSSTSSLLHGSTAPDCPKMENTDGHQPIPSVSHSSDDRGDARPAGSCRCQKNTCHFM